MKKLILGFFLIALSSFSFGQEITQKQIDFIKKESVGGKLDFSKDLENGKLYLVDGIAYNKNTYSVFLWGKAISKMGVRKSKTAISLWEEIANKQINKSEKKALNKGLKNSHK